MEANDRMSFLLALSTELARIHSPQELVCTAMARLRERLGAARVTLAEFDEATIEVIVLRESGGQRIALEIASLTLRPFAELAAESRRGVATVISDTRQDVRAAPLYEAWHALQDAGAILSTPLLANGALVALLSVISATAREWTESEVELVRSVADIVWPALEKARADRRVTDERGAPAARSGGGADRHMGLGSRNASGVLLVRMSRDSRPAMATARMLQERLAGQHRSAAALHCPLDARRVRHLRHVRNRVSLSPPAQRRSAGSTARPGSWSTPAIATSSASGWMSRERRQAEEALKEVNQRKDEFLAMLAHELRNPLAPIRNAAQLLNVHSSGKPEIEWARAVIERQTKHLVRLVDDLLDVSRMVRGQITLQKKPVELAEIVQTAVETSRPLIRLRKHHLTVELPEQPVRLECGSHAPRAGALEPAQQRREVHGRWRADPARRTARTATCVAIRVRDTGLGIVAESAAARLRPVHAGGSHAGSRRGRPRHRAHAGEAARRDARRHRRGAQRRAGAAARSSSCACPLLEAERDTPVQPAPADAICRSAAADARSLRILVVDDNVDAADSIAMLLSMEGHQTRTVNTARAALLAAPDFQPDVVLLDIGLPEMDGYEVARRLRAQNGRHDMRLVAVTGYGQPARPPPRAGRGFRRAPGEAGGARGAAGFPAHRCSPTLSTAA